VDVEIIFDHRVSRHAVKLEARGNRVQVTVSQRIKAEVLVALHPQIRSAITHAISDSAAPQKPRASVHSSHV